MKTFSKSIKFWKYAGSPAVIFALILLSFAQPGSIETPSDNIADMIENAMFTRSEFFDAAALVPRPTAEVSENLARLATNFPDNNEVLTKLVESDEKLGRFDNAEKILIRLSEIDANGQRNLALFYHRRGRFADKGKVLEKILAAAPPDQKADVIEELLDLARRHELKAYLQPTFYREIIAANADVFPVFEKLIDRLIEEKNYPRALELIRQAKTQFRGHNEVLLDKEVAILTETRNFDAAERAYRTAFDPFWSKEQAGKFYDFLSEHDRLREYGLELKTKFFRNPASFDAALRFAAYRKQDGGDISPVILKLEAAKKTWTTAELVTVTRLLLHENEGDLASRFLYTAYARDDFKADAGLRAKVLYQLFEMFSDAENQKLPITNGDLRFYEEIAKTDSDPGITTGILSLIFSDTDPKGELLAKETAANKFFNRAAAYRVFLSYKDEFPSSPELSQMYLDIVRLYTATGETEVAEKTLAEFAETFRDSSDYPRAALALADAFSSAGNQEKTRSICREILDHLGKQSAPNPSGENSISDAISIPDLAERNSGINVPKLVEKDGIKYEPQNTNGRFRDFLGQKIAPVTYAEVLAKLVASLAKEKKTAEILEVYSAEIAKYPQAEWLYEQRLTWLEQTNLTEDQLAVYREALKRFQSGSWSDKLARWFVRQKRQTEFAELSTGLVSRLSDTEIQIYLSQFIDSKLSAPEFEKQLYLQLYLSAHRRFPHNVGFVSGLLRFYRANDMASDWRRLACEYYFISTEVRKMYLDDLAAKGELRGHLSIAVKNDTIYKLFRADAAIRLSNFEQAAGAYRELNAAYPNSTEFAEPLIAMTRSLGQKDAGTMAEAAGLAHSKAEFELSSAEFRTRSGEIYAETGNYDQARAEWEKLISTGSGDREVYLDTATVYWDYYQYDDALRTIGRLRKKFADERLFAFETGAILESIHQPRESVREYIKALDIRGDEEQAEKSKNRLATLFKRRGTAAVIEAAFLAERKRQKNSAQLTLGYAKFLAAVKRPQDAMKVLGPAISISPDKDFLESVLDFYGEESNSAGEQAVLKRLADVSESPRRSIKYRLQLAKSFQAGRNRDAAKNVLAELINRFPTNYGVITEVSDLYHGLGFDTEAAQTLQNALERSRGKYRNEIASRLSRRLIQLDRLDEAEQVLANLHSEIPANSKIFRDLAGVYVRKGDPDAMRKAFHETVVALKKTNKEPRELDYQISELRTQMIDAFTRLKDYPSAIEQHIEIINREPENEALTDNAISYVKRHGGGDVLLNYYKKTAAEAFKNYRWNVVLARIYEANSDFENAVRSYKAAIADQPEMAELYLAAADLEVQRKNYNEAIKFIDTVLELTNDEPANIRRKIDLLKKAGRRKEVEALRGKLPPDAKKAQTDQFAAARDLDDTEGVEARRLYREAFAALQNDPLTGDMKAANIVDYVRSVRAEEPLDKIAVHLWELRQKLILLADEPNSAKAGEAKKRLSILDNAMTASIGEIAGAMATDDELKALHEDLKQRVDAVAIATDQHRTLSEIQDIAIRSHFGDLEELILIKRLQAASAIDRQTQIRSLVGFYNSRGAYEKALAAMEQYGGEDLSARAEAARLVGDRDKELDALRKIYSDSSSKAGAAAASDISRYLQLLHDGGHDELLALSAHSSPYQMQVINFLLAKGEAAAVHSAIESAEMPPVWKLSRHAEASLALKQFDKDADCFFCGALQLGSIGEMIALKLDKLRFPIGDDWFRLGREYGEWLYEAPHRTDQPARFLPAMTENLPKNAEEQSKLGLFYMEHKEWAAAIEHFRLATELGSGDVAVSADLGAAYYRATKRTAAKEIWDRSLADPTPNDLLVFFEELQQFGLEGEAASRVSPGIVKYLVDQNADDSEEVGELIHSVSESFSDQDQRAAYFKSILDRRPTDTSVAEMLINDELIDEAHSDYFYGRLIEKSEDDSEESDYEFTAVAGRTWSYDDAEAVFDQENEYKADGPESERFAWQKKYVDVLLGRKENIKAGQMIDSIEKSLRNRFARPGWLRLAKLQLQVREGKIDPAEYDRLIGISVSDLVSEIRPPSLERFNDALRMLKKEKRDAEAREISKRFFGRMLAIGNYESANFVGLAQSQSASGDKETALSLLRLMIDANEETTKDAAIAETAKLPAVSSRSADATKLGETENTPSETQQTVLALAAQTAFDLGQTASAITFRRTLTELDPTGDDNRIELAKLLASNDGKKEAADILAKLSTDRNVSRASRWRAKWQLHEMGEATDFADVSYDPFSQYYLALRTKVETERLGFLVNCLIAGAGSPAGANQELMRAYASANKPFAALKFAEADKSNKPDELLSILSAAAEKTGDFAKAIEFEKQKTDGGNARRLDALQQLADDANRPVADLTIDKENTRRL